MTNIYLDNAATTQVAPEVQKVMAEVYASTFGNPSSIHTVGQEAKKVLDESRETISSFVGCEPSEIVFTSGGSEGDNLAIRGLVAGIFNFQFSISNQISNSNDKMTKIPHIITSAVEHHAVLHTVQELEKEGKIEVTYIKPDGKGLITPEMVKAEIRESTVLISLIYVNNETGVVTPIREIGEMIVGLNNKRSTINNQRVYFHTDAVQAAEFLDISPDHLKVDLLTFTAHKLHGPKGVGALYIRKGTPIKSQITGGDQEFRLRAGTENIAGIAGFAKAVGLTSEDSTAAVRGDGIPRQARDDIRKLRDRLEEGIICKIPKAIVNGKGAERAPHILNVSFINAEGEAIILNLDFLGISVSSGSACTSRSLEPSHVLTAMGIPPEKAHGSVRFSLSRYTTEEEIDKAIEVLPNIIKKLREMSPFDN